MTTQVSGPFSEAEINYIKANRPGKSPSQIAADLGRSSHSVRNKCWALGITESSEWSECEIELLRNAYAGVSYSRDLDLKSIALRLSRDKANVCRKARSLGLTSQSRPKIPPSERKPIHVALPPEERSALQSRLARKRIAENGHPRGALGMKHKPEVKARIAQACRDRWASMTKEERDEMIFKRVKAKRDAGIPFANPRGNWKASWREVGDQRCFFRSRWEANYARYLEWLKAIGQIRAWEHEAKTFWFEGIKRGCVSYLPDFKVTNMDGSIEWHEVKGWMDDRSRTTLARMKKYHPNEKLVLIQEKTYNDIKNKVSRLIDGWEP
jgi:hypothetical protein